MFTDLFRGEYFPAVSLYMGARVAVNFGPSFRHPPPPPFRPFCEAVASVAAQHVMFDILAAVERRLAGAAGGAPLAAAAGAAVDLAGEDDDGEEEGPVGLPSAGSSPGPERQ